MRNNISCETSTIFTDNTCYFQNQLIGGCESIEAQRDYFLDASSRSESVHHLGEGGVFHRLEEVKKGTNGKQEEKGVGGIGEIGIRL